MKKGFRLGRRGSARLMASRKEREAERVANYARIVSEDQATVAHERAAKLDS